MCGFRKYPPPPPRKTTPGKLPSGNIPPRKSHTWVLGLGLLELGLLELGLLELGLLELGLLELGLLELGLLELGLLGLRTLAPNFNPNPHGVLFLGGIIPGGIFRGGLFPGSDCVQHILKFLTTLHIFFNILYLLILSYTCAI